MFPRMIGPDNTGVTVELGRLIEMGVKLWDFDYPVPRQTIQYNGKTAKVYFNKEELEQKIIDHYRFRQIGQETVGRFLHCFRARMREIMPYYVQLYEFDAIFRNIEDPLESYHLEETMDRDTKDTNTGTAVSTGDTTRKFSNTPQGSIDNLEKFMTEATQEMADGSARSTHTGDVKELYTMIRRGNIGVQPLGGEVENIRHAFINIDTMVIKELNDLFIKVY